MEGRQVDLAEQLKRKRDRLLAKYKELGEKLEEISQERNLISKRVDQYNGVIEDMGGEPTSTYGATGQPQAPGKYARMGTTAAIFAVIKDSVRPVNTDYIVAHLKDGGFTSPAKNFRNTIRSTLFNMARRQKSRGPLIASSRGEHGTEYYIEAGMDLNFGSNRHPAVGEENQKPS